MLQTIFLQITTPAAASDTATAVATQTVTQVAQPLVNPVPTEATLSLLDFLIKGGVIMIPIGILSLLSIYILIERWLVIRKASRLDSGFMNNIKDFIHNGNMEAAKSLCKNTNNPQAKMIEKGISRIGKPIKEISESVEAVGKIEVSKLEKNLSVLSIIAGIAPMFGFVGTIIGVIKIFYNIALADNISIGLIAGGLYEKMITSAAGLVVGIFSFVAFHMLNGMIDRLVNKMEVNTLEFIDLLQEPSK